MNNNNLFIFRVDVNQHSYFLVNPCRSGYLGYKEICPPDSNICFIINNTSVTDERQYLNYGSIIGKPTLENDEVIMRYNSDIKCDSSKNYTSKIIFICDANIESNSPIFEGLFDCENKFIWRTKHVCSSMEPCKVVDSIRDVT